MIKVKCITCSFEDNFNEVKKHCRKMNHNVFENNRVNVIVDSESFKNEFIEYCKRYFKDMLKREFDYIIESFNEDKFPELEGDDIDDIINQSEFISEILPKIIIPKGTECRDD